MQAWKRRHGQLFLVSAMSYISSDVAFERDGTVTVPFGVVSRGARGTGQSNWTLGSEDPVSLNPEGKYGVREN